MVAACHAAGSRPPVHEVAETATLVVLVAGGLGVGLVPEPVRSLGLDGVAYVALQVAPRVELALAPRDEGQSPATARVTAVVERCVVPDRGR